MFTHLFSIITLSEGDNHHMTIRQGRQIERIRRQRSVVGVLLLLCTFTLPAWASDPIVVGSKNFMESRLLSEMFSQLIEARTELSVTRRFGLAGTQVCFEALKTGGIDLYPEYSGTGLVTLLGEPPLTDRVSVLNRVRAEFLRRWNIWWLAPLGFENSYALALRRDRAQALNLQTISDLVRVAPGMKAGFGYEFIQRADGLVGLNESYGLQFQEVIGMQQTLKYQAADKGAIDLLDVYTTDGSLAVYDFVILEDDRHFFPPYDAAALVRGEILERHPELAPVIALLTNALDPSRMRELNLRIQEHGEPVAQVAHDALRTLGLVTHDQQPSTVAVEKSDSFLSYMWAQRATLACAQENT